MTISLIKKYDHKFDKKNITIRENLGNNKQLISCLIICSNHGSVGFLKIN